MEGIESPFLLVLLIPIGLCILAKYRKTQARRKIQREFFKTNLNGIRAANDEFSKHVDFKSGYFAKHQLQTWQNRHANLFNRINRKTLGSLKLPTEEVNTIETFIDYVTNGSNSRHEFNQRFVREELRAYSTFFDNVEGRTLDIQQRKAVVTDEDNNIVIAGAGSGKTTTIVAKVNYIINRYNIQPDDILLISFTRKSATTLGKRIDIPGVQAKTFHKFGKDVIVEVEGRQPSIFDDAQFSPLLKKLFDELIQNARFLKKTTDFITDYLKPTKSQFEFRHQGDYIQYIKDHNFKSYKLKQVIVNGKITYNMEIVKSIEECKIANFLLFNGLHYEYELPYEYDTANKDYRQYKPDFTIIQNEKKVYIEHFGISREGNVPNWFSGDETRTASQKYQDDMTWKRETHKAHDTILIESYSYEMREAILFENLTKNLTAAGIILEPLPPEEIWKIITKATQEEVIGLISLFETFITLMKSNNYTIKDVTNRNKQIRDPFTRKRNALFIELMTPIFQRYENHLINREEIDFSDMINRASEYIINRKYTRKFSYIIVDEFQDISIGRYQLINTLKVVNPSTKLFCVGDDWQSIYRFSGSDMALFNEFEKYFGFTVKSKIETTYRFFDPLINLSSDFIQKNPRQGKKELKGVSTAKKTEYHIRYSENNQDDTYALQNILHELIASEENIEDKEIVILGRYGFDFNRIKNEYSVFRIDKRNETISYNVSSKGKAKKITARFMTVHKAKGLEGDIIIILNCNSGKYGFPSKISDDQVLNLLLSDADQFENAEERRLFYVAMTRAKEKVYFVADKIDKSKFIVELEVEIGQSAGQKCPVCKTGDVVLRKSGKSKKGTTYNFFGCTNYLYGCNFTKLIWPDEADTPLTPSGSVSPDRHSVRGKNRR